MSSQQSIIGQLEPIFANIKLDIPFAQLNAISDPVKLEVAWDSSKYQLTGASVDLSATQTYDSGADLHITVNGYEMTTGLSWNAFETQKKTISIPIDLSLINGLNTFSLRYHTANGVITGQECIADATLRLTFLGQATGKNPASTSSPGGPSAWLNFTKSVSGSAKWVIALVVVGGIVYVVYRLTKFNPFNWVKDSVSNFKR